MSQKRTIDQSFWKDEKIGRLSLTARLIFIGLWSLAEDTGVGRANPVFLKNALFPYDDMLLKDFEAAFEQLQEQGLILCYENNSDHYYWIRNFSKYQYIRNPAIPTLPVPIEIKGLVGELLARAVKNRKRSKNDPDGNHRVILCNTIPSAKEAKMMELLPCGNVEVTSTSHRGNAEVTPTSHRGTIKEKKVKENKINQNSIIRFGSMENVLLTAAEHRKLAEKLGQTKTDKLIEKMSLYLAQQKKSYHNYYAALLLWHQKELEAEGEPSGVEKGDYFSTEFEKEAFQKLYEDAP